MPTIGFEICLKDECNGFEFIETTGRYPSTTTGYGQIEDISGHTGVLTWYDCEGTEIVSFDDVSVSANKARSSHTFSQKNVSVTDGWYKLKYTVKDSTGTEVGSYTNLILLDCTFICDLGEIVKNTVSGNPKNREKNGVILNEARILYENSKVAANMDMFEGACELFKSAQQKIKTC